MCTSTSTSNLQECYESNTRNNCDCLTGSETEKPYVQPRVRLWFLLQACKKSFLQGPLWNRLLADMKKLPNHVELVCWWRAAVVGALTMLSARNSSQLLAWLDVDSQSAPSSASASASEFVSTDSSKSKEKKEMKRIHSLAGTDWSHAATRERHRDDAALTTAELALDFPVCALEFDETMYTVENYKSNAQVVAIIEELTTFSYNLLKLSIGVKEEEQSYRPRLEWAFQLMDVMLTRARLFPLAGRLIKRNKLAIKAKNKFSEFIALGVEESMFLSSDCTDSDKKDSDKKECPYLTTFLGILLKNTYRTVFSSRLPDHKIPFFSASK